MGTTPKVRYPWLMQITWTTLGLAWLWWFGFVANSPRNLLQITVPTLFVAIGGAFLAGISPVLIWTKRKHGKPDGFFCSRCHKDMTEEETVMLHVGGLVCGQCHTSLEGMGEECAVRLKPDRTGQ